MPTLLVVDDEPNVLYSLESSLRSPTLQVVTAGDAKNGIGLVRSGVPDAVLLDVRLPDMSGLDAFAEIQKIDPHLPVIMMTAYTTTDTAIEAIKRGAFEYLLKPVDLRQLRSVVDRAIELSQLSHIPAEFSGVAQLETSAENIVGRSATMQEVYKAIGRVAATDVNVLILGESGTGKELVARAIHHHSRRTENPMLAINCAAIPETLLESELFGHEKGSFTGADRLRIGRFEQAHGSTIFLDEIGDMSGATQAKVLRLLQDQCFERVGGNQTIQTDVRVIAATNQNLEELVTAGRFRRDLFYRLKVFTVELPPLRERLDDFPLLVEHFIKLYNRDIGKNVRTMAPDAIRLLTAYHWPGNVRELQSCIKHAMVNARGDVLTLESFPNNLVTAADPANTQRKSTPGALDVNGLVHLLLRAGGREIYRDVQLAVDRAVLTEVLRHVQGNQVEASRLLGISRTTLRAKLQMLGMKLPREYTSDPDQAGQ